MHSDSLISNNLQFSYKAGMSTTQCTWAAHEIISYYNNKCKFMQCLSNSNNNKLVHLYNICHKKQQSPSGLNITRIACEYNFTGAEHHNTTLITSV